MEESARMLIFNGANLNEKDKKGNTPMHASKVLNKRILGQILKEK